MNKYTIDENQLQRVKYFIWQKRIEDADAINEVLDHFACKVEELINENMYLPLDKAMQQAYQSFGKDGFKIIVEQYTNRIKRAYWIYYKLSFLEVIKTKGFALGILWCCISASLLSYILSFNLENWLSTTFIYSAMACVFGSLAYQAYSFWTTEIKYDFYFCDLKNLNQWQKTIRKRPRIGSINLLFLFLLPFLKLNVNFYIYLMMLMGLFSLLDHLIRKKTKIKLSQKLSLQ